MSASNPNQYGQSVNVSIIIPAHNAEETLRETLDSVLAQTVPNWEVVIVDDGSLDKTAEIAAQYVQRDSRIRLIQQAQMGEAGARNAGLPLANFDWILFLDSDDWIAPAYLEKMTEALIKKPELDAVLCRSARVAKNGTRVIEKYVPPSGDLFPVLARRAAFPVHACLVRRSIVESVGMFDPSLEKSPDWDLWQRIARTGAKFGAVDEVLAFYRMKTNAASLDAAAMLRDGLRVLKRGHSADPRVTNALPEHANGLPAEQIASQEFYLLCWCAGLMLGAGKLPATLLNEIGTDAFPDLYPPSVAQCIFDSAPLPNCEPPGAWINLAPKIFNNLEQFLHQLERQSKAKDLARRATMELKKMILKESELYAPLIREFEQNHEKQKTELLNAYQALSRLETEKLDGLNRIDDAWAENAKCQERIQQLESARSELQMRTDALNQELENTRRTSQSEIQSLKTQLNTEHENLQALRADFETTITQLNSEIRQTRAAHESKIREQDEAYATLQGEKEKLAEIAAERKQTIAALRKTLWVRVGKKFRFVN